MPELPEVRVTSKNLNREVKGKTIAKIITTQNTKMFKEHDIEKFRQYLIGETILGVDNRAKFIVFKFTSNKILLSHLRMEGKYSTFNKQTPLGRNEHVSFVFSDGSDLHYNDTRVFGTFHIRNTENYLKINPLAKVAPIPKNINFAEFYAKVSKSRRAVKTILLDQSVVAGLGNIYVNEALFFAKIHPSTPAKNVPRKKYQEILKIGQDIMDRSTLLGGTTIKSYVSLNNKEGTFQKFLKIHGKNKEQCFICETKIEKIKVNGRGTYFCPKCQKNTL